MRQVSGDLSIKSTLGFSFYLLKCEILSGRLWRSVVAVEHTTRSVVPRIHSDYFPVIGAMCGPIRQKLLHVATFTLPWAVELSRSYDTISNMCGLCVLDVLVLTNIFNQYPTEYVGLNAELVVAPVNNAVAPASQLTCQHLPAPDALFGEIQGATFNGTFRAFFVPGPSLTSAFCTPSPLDYMRMISRTGREALALFFALNESNFKMPSD
jgi:hypothetical protein